MKQLAPVNVRSFNGCYTAHFRQSIADCGQDIPNDRPIHVLIDSNVADLHKAALDDLVKEPERLYAVDAHEEGKSLEAVPGLIRRLVEGGIRRDHLIVAVGGGIVQDLACFTASILFRGMDWALMPTTLLAQADSCIGSKSSINTAGTKNLVGTFYPPKLILIAAQFLNTLSLAELRSGVGEMLKVHAIAGPSHFDRIAAKYNALFADKALMLEYVRASLMIKRTFIEADEFDRGSRNVLNYGHSFGHAIEAATEFTIPHGIAVTIGMDLANFVATRLGRLPLSEFQRMHITLRENYSGFEKIEIPQHQLLLALKRDKKNIGNDLVLILPTGECEIEKVRLSANAAFEQYCAEYLQNILPGTAVSAK